MKNMPKDNKRKKSGPLNRYNSQNHDAPRTGQRTGGKDRIYLKSQSRNRGRTRTPSSDLNYASSVGGNEDSFREDKFRASKRGPETKSVIPFREHARLNGFITAVSDGTYLTVRLNKLIPNTSGGVANIQTQMDTALRSFLPRESMKDLTVDELADGPDYLTAVWELYQCWYAQALIRSLAPAHVGYVDANAVTTEAIWQTDLWNTITGRLANVLIPKGLVDITVELNPIVVTSLPQDIRRYKGSSMLYWCPSMTATEFLTALGTIQTYTEAGNYFAKCGIPMVKCPISITPKVVDPYADNAYNYFMHNTMPIYRRNSGNTGVFQLVGHAASADTEILDAALLTGFHVSDTWYTDLAMMTTPGEPFSELYALVRILQTYDATHNVTGAVYFCDNADLGTTLAGDKLYAAYAAHDATVFTILPDSELTILAPAIAGSYVNQSTQTTLKLMGDARTANIAFTRHHPLETANMESSWLPDSEANFLAKILGGKFYATKSSSHTPAD